MTYDASPLSSVVTSFMLLSPTTDITAQNTLTWVRKPNRGDDPDGQPPPTGAKVRGRLDWERRHALMRTHTALHMLSGGIGRDYGALVTGGNFEEAKARMDFELSSMSAEFAEAVEQALRVEVDADRPVHVSFLSPEEFAARPELIRTKANLVPQGLEVIRVVDIEGLDRQADGGTHVASTGEVGTIYVVGHQSKGKGNKRLRIALDPVPAPAGRWGTSR